MLENIIKFIRENNAEVVALQCVSESLANDEGRAFVDSVCANTVLTSLHLIVHSEVGAGEAIKTILCNNTTLCKLHVGSSIMGPEQCEIIADSLHKNTSLEYLNINSNDISVTGAPPFGRMLEVNTCLTKLDLSCNDLRNGAMHIVSSLHTNSTLTFLDLDWNGCEDCVGQAALDVLQVNSTLNQLGIRRNPIANEITDAIVDELKERRRAYVGPRVKVALPVMKRLTK